MENELPWINQMREERFQFEEPDPHLQYSCLQEYLAYYSFDLTEVDEYRCGSVPSHHQQVFIQAFLKKKSKGTVFFIHGYLDHTGGLSRTVNFLLANGYQVITVDLPGHGFSQGESGTISTFNEYVEAVKCGYEFIKKDIALSPVIGLGHSTGGAILFHAASEKIVHLDKLILVAPLYYPYRWNITRGTLKFIGKFIPQSKRRFKKNSEDLVYRQFVKSDPLQGQQLKSAWILAMEKWQTYIANCPILHTPVYFLQGEKDTTVDWKENIHFYRHKCKDIQIAFFPSGRHQLLNEEVSIRYLVHDRMKHFLEKNT